MYLQKLGLYKINLGLKGDGIYDLPFIGNLGKDGEDALINKLNEYRDVYLLIHKEKYWQESDKFREYVKTNYQKTGDVLHFDIYYVE